MEEERAKFTIWESIADNLWDKYNYKILRRETQRTGKTLSKTGGNHGSRTASFDVGKHVMLASKKESFSCFQPTKANLKTLLR